MLSAVCVFAGSRTGSRREYSDAARQLGRELAERGHTLIYGGGGVGLMGELSRTVMENGGRVIGIIPRMLVEREVAHYEISELHIVNTMHERKAMMAELSDGVIALPGGLGTLEELFEMLTWTQLGIHDKPVGLLNVGGYYDTLLAFLDETVGDGFIGPEHRSLLITGDDPAQLLDVMSDWRSGSGTLTGS